MAAELTRGGPTLGAWEYLDRVAPLPDAECHQPHQDAILGEQGAESAVQGVGWLYWLVVALGMLTMCALLVLAARIGGGS